MIKNGWKNKMYIDKKYMHIHFHSLDKTMHKYFKTFCGEKQIIHTEK